MMRRALLVGIILMGCGLDLKSETIPDSKAAKAPAMSLNEKSDGGPGVYVGTIPGDSGSLIDPAIAKDFPLTQRNRIYVLGGGVRGFGMLAEYTTAGEKRFLVARRTGSAGAEPYTPVALARVFDPDGNLAAIEDFTDQAQETEVRILKVPNGKPGIWRVSFSGGRRGDLVEIRLAETPIWGVRGEMALSVSNTTPRPAYFWIPPTARKLHIGVESGQAQGLVVKSATTNQVIVEGTSASSKKLLAETVPSGTVCRLEFPAGYDGVIDFEGAPGLLCPSEKAARRLQGGTIDCDGIPAAGPLQARARRWMMAHRDLERQPTIAWPQSVPADLESPQLEVLLFGKYGGLNGLGNTIKDQNATLDLANPYFGIPWPTGLKAGDEKQDSWINFLPYAGGFVSLYDSTNLAILYTTKMRLNPVYHHENILQRAILAGFFHIATLQGDDLIRDNSLLRGSYPLTHTFFIYEGLAASYRMLKDSLPPEPKEIWRQAIMAIGDKVADHQAYESNQWAHMMKAHLNTYLATGEKRFLRNFEAQMQAYLSGAYGPDSKFGQHPAGYFLEEYGPDGNYDRLNLYAVVSSYNDYKKLPEAKPSLVSALKQGIEKNLKFKSFFWLPRPSGSLHSPTALNCRTSAMFCYAGYPGEYLACNEFPIAAARRTLDLEPAEGVGVAATTSFVANTPAWIQRMLQQGVAWGPDYYPSSSVGDWVENVAKVYAEKTTVAPEKLPFQQKSGFWELPGFLAWKQGPLYGLIFYDVDGAQRKLTGVTGGGPTALWTAGTGSFIASMQPDKSGKAGHLKAETKTILGPDQLTYSCIYGTDEKGTFFASGHERAQFKKIEPQRQWEITSKIISPGMAVLRWNYQINDQGLDLTVSLRSLNELPNVFLNLPILVSADQVTATLETKNRLVISSARSSVILEWPETYAGKLEGSCLSDIKRLVIPLPVKGASLPIRIRVMEKAASPLTLFPAINLNSNHFL